MKYVVPDLFRSFHSEFVYISYTAALRAIRWMKNESSLQNISKCIVVFEKTENFEVVN